MIKFNKDKFEIFTGWLIILIVMINILCPVAGIIAGELFISKNYFSLIIAILTILMSAYMLATFEVDTKLKKY